MIDKTYMHPAQHQTAALPTQLEKWIKKDLNVAVKLAAVYVFLQIWVSRSWKRWFLVTVLRMSWLSQANTVLRFAIANSSSMITWPQCYSDVVLNPFAVNDEYVGVILISIGLLCTFGISFLPRVAFRENRKHTIKFIAAKGLTNSMYVAITVMSVWHSPLTPCSLYFVFFHSLI